MRAPFEAIRRTSLYPTKVAAKCFKLKACLTQATLYIFKLKFKRTFAPVCLVIGNIGRPIGGIAPSGSIQAWNDA